MKKLEKLKGKKPIKYLVNVANINDLQKNKYLIFKYKDNEKFIWKFIKTSKIEKIENIDKRYFNIFSTVENNIYLTDKSSTFVTEEFTLAKVMCDQNNRK